MSSVSGLDQLCAAACDNEALAVPADPTLEEIKVREIDAFASVADLIHAAILANSGAASLKEIYEVCEQHGRIAYRRADGSRLITSNDHWKSQVRHALYTGGRFERVPSNGEYWQLTQAFRRTAAELVKVLVRADDRTQHVRATLALAPSMARAVMPNIAGDTPAGGTARQRRKRAAAGEASAEAMCDSVDPAAPASMRAPPARQRARTGGDSSAPDNHSTQDEGREAPARRAPRRAVRRAAWKPEDGGDELVFEGESGEDEEDEEEEQKYVPVRQPVVHAAPFGSKDSADPSTLRWGTTALRSTIIISAADSSGLSAGRTPLLPRAGGGRKLGGGGGARRRDASAEADSVPKGPGGAAGGPRWRQAVPTPGAADDARAQITPPTLMAQLAEAVQQQMDEQQKAAMWAGGGAPGGYPPMAVLPSMLPGLLAAAAPYLASGHSSQMAVAAAHQHQQRQHQQALQQQQAALQQIQAALIMAAAAGGGGGGGENGGAGGHQ